MTVGARLAVADLRAREARLDDDHEGGHAQRRRTAPRAPRAPSARARSRAALQARARPQHGEARRRRRRAPPRPPTRTASAGSAGPACRPGRGRARSPGAPSAALSASAATRASRRLTARRRASAICSPAVLELDHEAPVDRRLERERHRAALGHVLLDVVAVDVDLVGGVGRRPEADLVALVELELLDAALRLGVDDAHRRRRRRRGARARSAVRGRARSPVCSCRWRPSRSAASASLRGGRRRATRSCLRRRRRRRSDDVGRDPRTTIAPGRTMRQAAGGSRGRSALARPGRVGGGPDGPPRSGPTYRGRRSYFLQAAVSVTVLLVLSV